MENKDILNALQNYEMIFGTAENILNGGLVTDAERDFVMRDSNAFLFGLIADGALKVGIGARFALSQAADAHRALESRATTGSLVLLPQGV